MNHRITLRKFNGHWFMAVGSKGYACTKEFEEFLNDGNLTPGVYNIADKPSDLAYDITQALEDDKVITQFLSPSSETPYIIPQCPKLFEDLDLPTQFYLNRGNS